MHFPAGAHIIEADNRIIVFRAGCKSPPEVIVLERPSGRRNRCDSGTDSIVWMEEDVKDSSFAAPW